MPDKDDEKDSDKYSHGGFEQDSGGGVYAVLDGAGSSADYASWDWKQIKAAITGGAAYSSGSGGSERAAGVSDPASLWRAGNALLQVQRVLEMVGRQLEDQATAVAGGEGAVWRGEAAQQFLLMMRGFSQKVQAAAEVLSGGGTGINSVPNQLVANGNSLSQAITLVEAIDSHYATQARLMGVAAMDNGLIPVSQKPQVVELLNRDMRRVLMDLADHYSITINAIRQPPPVTNPLAGSPNGLLSQSDALTSPSGLGTLAPPSGDLASLDALGGPVDAPQEFTAPNLASAPSLDGAGIGDNGLVPTDFSGAGLDTTSTSAAPFTPQAFPGSLDLESGIGGSGADSSAPFLNTSLPPLSSARSTNTDTRVPDLGGVTEFPGLTTPNVPTFERGRELPTSTDQGVLDSSFALPEYSPAEFPGLPGLESSGAGGGGLSSPGGLPSEFPTQTGVPDAPSEFAASGLPDLPATDRGLSPEASGTDQPSASHYGAPPAAGGQEYLAGSQAGAGMPMMPMMPGMGGAGSPGGAGEPSDASGLLIPRAEPWSEGLVRDDMETLVEGEIAGAAAGSGELVNEAGEAVEVGAWGEDGGEASSTGDAAGAQGQEPAAGAPASPHTTSTSGGPGGISPPDTGVDTGLALTAAAGGAALVAGAVAGAAAASSRRSTRADDSTATLNGQSWGDETEARTPESGRERGEDNEGDSSPDTPDTPAQSRTVTDDWDRAGSPFPLGRRRQDGEAEGGVGSDPEGNEAARLAALPQTHMTVGREGEDDEQPLAVWRPRSAAPPPVVAPVSMPLRSGGDDGAGFPEPARDAEADTDVESRAASRFADLLSQSEATWDGDGDRRTAPGVLE